MRYLPTHQCIRLSCSSNVRATYAALSIVAYKYTGLGRHIINGLLVLYWRIWCSVISPRCSQGRISAIWPHTIFSSTKPITHLLYVGLRASRWRSNIFVNEPNIETSVFIRDYWKDRVHRVYITTASTSLHYCYCAPNILLSLHSVTSESKSRWSIVSKFSEKSMIKLICLTFLGAVVRACEIERHNDTWVNRHSAIHNRLIYLEFPLLSSERGTLGHWLLYHSWNKPKKKEFAGESPVITGDYFLVYMDRWSTVYWRPVYMGRPTLRARTSWSRYVMCTVASSDI